MLRLRWGLAATRPHLLVLILACAAIRAAGPVRELSWADIAPPLRQLLARHGIHQENLSKRLGDIRERNRARVGEGDRDHLIYYVLQSTAFTKLPPIEPALSARELAATGKIPATAKARIDAFMSSTKARSSTKEGSARMAIFREMLARERVDLMKEYARAMAFAAPVGAQYQARGLSTDTSIDANYAVYLSLAALRRLEPDRRIRSVLIVGPGIDLAPRTGFVESHEPQSYQPFAVMDALLATGLSQRETLRVTGADINPRVVEWLTRARGTRPMLTIAAGIQETPRVKFSEDYREYFSVLGKAIGSERPMRDGSRRMGKSLTLAPGVTDAIDAATADITVERLDSRYDLAVVTNVFPYLSDSELLLAMSNIARMLSPGGILIHNEPRPVLAEALALLRMPLLQNRSGVVASVDGSAPLYDAAWMHAVLSDQ
jgi:SAM-dependent methyltransferase